MAEYRIDDLARRVGTTARNIRAYQQRGLLHPPRLLGRVGVYSETHVRRLRRILSLLSRGYDAPQIQELLDAWDRGLDIEYVLDLEEVITEPWSVEDPVPLPADDLAHRVGDERTIERLEALGWLERTSDGAVFQSRRLLESFEEAHDLGWSREELVGLYESLTREFDAVADDFVSTAAQRLIADRGPTWVPEGEQSEELAFLLVRLRRLTLTTVRVMLAGALERRTRQEVQAHLDRVARGRDD